MLDADRHDADFFFELEMRGTGVSKVARHSIRLPKHEAGTDGRMPGERDFARWRKDTQSCDATGRSGLIHEDRFRKI